MAWISLSATNKQNFESGRPQKLQPSNPKKRTPSRTVLLTQRSNSDSKRKKIYPTLAFPDQSIFPLSHTRNRLTPIQLLRQSEIVWNIERDIYKKTWNRRKKKKTRLLSRRKQQFKFEREASFAQTKAWVYLR